MARQVILLDRLDPSGPGPITFRAAFWLVVPVARKPFNVSANFTSAVVDGSVTGPELTALRDGSVNEIVETFTEPPGTSLPNIKAHLVAEFTARQAELNANNPWQRYGTFYDGVSWTDKAVA